METFFVKKTERKDKQAKTHQYVKKCPTKKVHRQKIAEVPNTCFEKRS